MIQPGTYRHFKGGKYRMMFTAEDAETGYQVVMYMSMADG